MDWAITTSMHGGHFQSTLVLVTIDTVDVDFRV